MRIKLCTWMWRHGWHRLAWRISPAICLLLATEKAYNAFMQGLKDGKEHPDPAIKAAVAAAFNIPEGLL